MDSVLNLHDLVISEVQLPNKQIQFDPSEEEEEPTLSDSSSVKSSDSPRQQQQQIPKIDGLHWLRTQMDKNAAFDDDDVKQLDEYIAQLKEDEEKQKLKWRAVESMRQKIQQRSDLLQKSEEYVDFGQHPALAKYFVDKHERLVRLMQKSART